MGYLTGLRIKICEGICAECEKNGITTQLDKDNIVTVPSKNGDRTFYRMCRECFNKFSYEARKEKRYMGIKIKPKVRIRLDWDKGVFEKFCPKCQKWKSIIEHFNKDIHKPDNISQNCKQCQRSKTPSRVNKFPKDNDTDNKIKSLENKVDKMVDALSAIQKLWN
jgi:hypothetical protein